MAKLVAIMDSKKRDAHIALGTPRRPPAPKTVGPKGLPVKLERLIRGTVETSYDGLARKYTKPEELTKALVASDPEVPVEVLGRRLGDAARVYLRSDGSMLTVARLLEVVRGPDGAEKSRGDFKEIDPTVDEETPPLAWTGRLVPVAEAVRKFAFTRKLQLLHVSGLTFEFLYEIAKTLSEEKKLLYVGAGPKGQKPLIFSTNGAPYRGFLEGRIEGETYRLVLHLSNLELKAPPSKPADKAPEAETAKP